MIDEELKAWHMKNLKFECSKRLYDRLCAACEGRKGGIKMADQDMIFDACTTEDIKERLRLDILGRGVVCSTYNGGQQYTKENKSVGQLRAYIDAQRKIFSDLRITPARRGEEAAAESDFDAL